jgi:hypothetical protein
MRIDDDGVIRFQEGGLAYDHLARYMEAGGGKDERAGGGPNDPNFNWGLYNSLVRDPYMGGYTGFGPDLTAALEGSLNPTGIMLDQDAISKAIADYQASLTPATPASKLPTGFTEQDILDYFNTPGLTPLQAAQTMQQYNVQPEDIASILGLTPEAARSQYNAALAPFAPAGAPAATTTTPPVVDYTKADQGTDPLAFLEDYFDTPGLTPEDAVRRIKELGISPEQAASYLGISPTDARQQYNAVIAAQQAEADRLREERTKAEADAAAAQTVANTDTSTEGVIDIINGGATAPTTGLATRCC